MPEIISMMTGRQLSEVFPERPPLDTTRETLLEVKDLAQKGRLAPLTFTLRRGEILGFAGLEGCGKEQIFHMLFGLNPEGAGQVRYQDRSVNIRHPSNAIDLGWGLIPANRRDEGIILDWSILDNTTLVILNRLKSQLGLVNRGRARRTVNRFVERLNIVTDNLRKRVINLSGGNQQKVVLAKWLATDPKLLILNDPTRGVDVGSKVEIYNLVHDLAEAGLGILFTSSELDEILGLCDRIIVLYKGRTVFECRRGEATKQEVLQYVNGSGSGTASLNGKANP
jgi:ABC-type sugar transport system ATPase subunit